MSFYIDRTVSVRISKYSYGVSAYTLFDLNDPQHQKRKDNVYMDDEGDLVLGGQYAEILGKVAYLHSVLFYDYLIKLQNVSLAEDTEFRRTFRWIDTSLSGMTAISIDLLSYRGSRERPRWMDNGGSELY